MLVHVAEFWCVVYVGACCWTANTQGKCVSHLITGKDIIVAHFPWKVVLTLLVACIRFLSLKADFVLLRRIGDGGGGL